MTKEDTRRLIEAIKVLAGPPISFDPDVPPELAVALAQIYHVARTALDATAAFDRPPTPDVV